jgi:predicted CXXCH cytochrome family protein
VTSNLRRAILATNMRWGGVFLLVLVAAAAQGAGQPSYIGAAACAKCHAEMYAKWSRSRHSKMVQPATPQSVTGDFSRRQVQLRGATYRLREHDGAFYIAESDLFGKEQEHRVDYTLGNRRIQHYLATLPSGKIVVLPPTWDVLRKQWFHAFDISDPDEISGVAVQVWNKNCYSCHVSKEEKNFDIEENLYKTAWLDFGTNCERCHGPGSEHAAHYAAPKTGAVAAAAPPADAPGMVVQTRLDPARNTMVCAQCHSFRDIYVNGFVAGADYYDYFLPILEYNQPVDRDPAYWPDGRTRRFSNDAFGLWQSECFIKGGATCLTCHTDAHQTEIEKNPQLRPDADALCTHCHTAIGQAVPAHTHHAVRSSGSSCVECHMPRTVLSIKAEIRDHSMSIPVPENTIHFQIPNACNGCHKNRDAAWSLENMKRWYGDGSRQKLIRRAEAFSQARDGNPAAVSKLLDILNTPSEGPLVRANAAGYLSRFQSDPRVSAALLGAFTDAQALVRAVAVLGLSPRPANREATVKALSGALADSAATVRIGAAVGLVGMGIRQLPGADGERFERAQRFYAERAALNSDDAAQQLAAGRFQLLMGDYDKAITALRGSLRLDPEIPARYFLAYAYAQQGKATEARTLLLAIPVADPQYANAQKLLKALGDATPVRK